MSILFEQKRLAFKFLNSLQKPNDVLKTKEKFESILEED